MVNLVEANTPAAFWRLAADPQPTAAEWSAAVEAAAGVLPARARAAGGDVATLLQQTLAEAQFGRAHWRLSAAKRCYYQVKPFLPRPAMRRLRRLYGGRGDGSDALRWPLEDRYASFQWGVVAQLLARSNRRELPYIAFWPDGYRYAFVLTHDVETADGQACVRAVADLDAAHGFRSSFNFVAERYALDQALIDELRERGFEIGVHGLKHDGKLFSSRAEFLRRAQRINRHLRRLGAVGFRAPLTHRQPEWMQALDIEYDSSFFDTDPYEPIAGGTMSLWPFALGRFIELPYTLVQDYTLTEVLGERTPKLWLDKVEQIERYSGLALLNAHPDYLKNPPTRRIYTTFLEAMRARSGYWHALPKDVARWWRARMQAGSAETLPGAVVSHIR